ncbi:exonuclease [Yersinia phage vB_YenM_P744]
MTHIMIDIEGMNKLPSAHKTRIMQVAAAPFDELGVLSLPTFNQFVNLEVLPWTEDNPETKEWWNHQPNYSDMINYQTERGITARELCLKLNDYIRGIELEFGEVTLWACHPEYDITAIYSYMEAFSIEPAWMFYKVKDYATVRDRYKEALPRLPVTHWAHEDVLRQIKLLNKCCQLGWSL